MTWEHEPNRMHLKFRMLLYFGILAIGMLVCVRGLTRFYMYPLGLMFTVWRMTKIETAAGVALIIGYSVHALLLLSFLATKRRWVVFCLTVIMVILTILNVSGCQHLLDEYT